MTKKFNIFKFVTYLFCGLLILGGFGVYNFYKYEHVESTIQAVIAENVSMIEDSVADINSEQSTLRHVQRIYAPPMVTGEVMAMGPTNNEYAELQARIEKLEAEKKALEESKTEVVGEIKSMFDIFKFDTGNPFINIVFLPFVAYSIKKILDFLFARLEERAHEHFEEEHI